MSLTEVDWSALPKPVDDGAADHLAGRAFPDAALVASDGSTVSLAALPGVSVIYVYPMTGRPDQPLPDGWDMIPGARGCTPQSCAFRDHFKDLQDLGVAHLFGVSTQTSAYQAEAAARLHLPFPLLSDHDHAFGDALRLPSFDVAGVRLLKRLTLIADAGVIRQVHYPVFPPDQDAARVMAWLQAYRAGA
ncbi:MAG: peroxiredoxin [Pseudomonadota bacterium]